MTAVSPAALTEQVRALLPNITPGPWEALYGTPDNPRAEPGAVVLQRACHESYWRDYCFVSDARTGRSFDDARLIALAPQMAAALDALAEALAQAEAENDAIIEAVWRSLPEHGGKCPQDDPPSDKTPCLRCRVLVALNGARSAALAAGREA